MLMAAHCAGMVDLVALPVWVGTLIAHYKLDPQMAGGLATLFLLGAVIGSVFFARSFDPSRARIATSVGFAVAAAAFFGVAGTSDYATMAVLHAVAGLATGCALSFTHGTIGRSLNPHRLFAMVGLALGVFAIVFLGATPQLVAALGGAVLFKVFAGVMVVAAALCALAFPHAEAAGPKEEAQKRPLPAAVWFGIFGISCMALVQAMTASFIERIGADRGFGVQIITGVFIAMGIVNLFPAPLAALLERRWSAYKVTVAGPVLQAALALVVTQSVMLAPFAVSSSLFVAVMIFTHTFAFGLLARLDDSGRALAATPAMLMVGAAIGPLLGGTLVKTVGYAGIGFAAVAIAAIAVACFSRTQRKAVPGVVPG